MKKLFFSLLTLSILFTACKNKDDKNNLENDIVESQRWDGFVYITWSNDGVSITKDATVKDVVIESDNMYVTVKSKTTDNIVYELSGTCNDGAFKIYSDKKFQVKLNNLDLTSKNGPVLNLQSKKRCFMVLDGTNNFSDEPGYVTDKEDIGSNNEDAKGAIFSEGQIVISGEGTLNLKGQNKHALASDEYIFLRSGNIDIKEAHSDGIHTKDYYKQEGGELIIKCTNDAIDVSKGYIKLLGGRVNITTSDDGFKTTYGDDDTDTEAIDASITMENTQINIKALHGKAIYANGDITLGSGFLQINGKKDKTITTNPNKSYTVSLAEGCYFITEN